MTGGQEKNVCKTQLIGCGTAPPCSAWTGPWPSEPFQSDISFCCAQEHTVYIYSIKAQCLTWSVLLVWTSKGATHVIFSMPKQLPNRSPAPTHLWPRWRRPAWWRGARRGSGEAGPPGIPPARSPDNSPTGRTRLQKHTPFSVQIAHPLDRHTEPSSWKQVQVKRPVTCPYSTPSGITSLEKKDQVASCEDGPSCQTGLNGWVAITGWEYWYSWPSGTAPLDKPRCC